MIKNDGLQETVCAERLLAFRQSGVFSSELDPLSFLLFMPRGFLKGTAASSCIPGMFDHSQWAQSHLVQIFPEGGMMRRQNRGSKTQASTSTLGIVA